MAARLQAARGMLGAPRRAHKAACQPRSACFGRGGESVELITALRAEHELIEQVVASPRKYVSLRLEG
jgi:hypothetical protein